ncbi:MAG: molybdopterin-dependent oxidoreductase [Myxococcales bacterium]|nr:molybdopterin-dependent oxidoreductase [Myxococcales bacterium]MCB9628481.1 molybdopterin-dependent oxidoreductase [Sandaracinaceae bacterium]
MHTVPTFCRICEASCGLLADVEGERVVALRPDPEHVSSKGFVCIKGVRYLDVHDSPDRVKTPLRRVPGTSRFEPISWETAFREIGARTRAIRERHGQHAVATFLGNPAAFSIAHAMFATAFSKGLGTRNVYGSSTQDCSNKFAVAERMYGSAILQPVPDLGRTQMVILIGTNPAISQMSFVHAPNAVDTLLGIEARGGRVVHLNPRRTETAERVGEQVFIRPDTDVFFLLSFLQVLFADHDPGAVPHARGQGALRELVAAFPPERTETVTRVDAAQLRELVRAFVAAPSASVYASTGLNMGQSGSLAFWLVNAINVLSGNLDREGGAIVPHGMFPLAPIAHRVGFGRGHARSRIGDFEAVLDQLPGAILPDEILTPGPEQVRALFVTAGNPVLSCANEERMRAALEQLELLVCVDLFRNETGQLAHYVLPGLSFLERSDLPLGAQGFMTEPYLQYTPAVVQPDGDQRHEWWIFRELAHAIGVPLLGVRVSDAWGAMDRRLRRLPLVGERLAFHPDQLYAGMVAATGQTTLGAVKRRPHGRPLRRKPPGDFVPGRLLTSDKRIDLAPADLLDAAEGLEALFERERATLGELRLITKRERNSHNSWMHNVEGLVRGKRARNYLYMRADDAAAEGLSDGALARVAANGRELLVHVRITDDLAPRVVALPHGWGHERAEGLRVAKRTSGVNANWIAADGPDAVERISGMTRLTGFPVSVSPAP